MPIYTWPSGTVQSIAPPAPYVAAWEATLPAANLNARVIEWERIFWTGAMPLESHAEALIRSSPDGQNWSPYNAIAAIGVAPWIQVQLRWYQLPTHISVPVTTRPWLIASATTSAAMPTIEAVRLTYRQVRAWTLGSYVFVTNPTARTQTYSPMQNTTITQGGQFAGVPVNPMQTESIQLWLYAPNGAVDPSLATDLETVVKQSPVVLTDDRGVQHRVTIESMDRTSIITKQNGRGYQVSMTIRILA